MKLHRAPHEAIVVQSGGPIYQGHAGQTRTERVHLVELDGSVRSVEVHRVVNVATHPDLKPRVLAGQLHRLEDGRELALPFVYHDPNVRKFALVIPPALAHLEMKEWARLMTEVAEDTTHPIPPYVRDGMTVLGLGALELFLESGVEPDDAELKEVPESQRPRGPDVQVREQALAERERMLRERERESSEQEQALIRMAKDLASQEAALRRREQQMQTARADLDAREAELKEHAARARAAAHEAAVVPDGEWQEVSSGEPKPVAPEPATVVTAMAEMAQATEVQDSEIADMLARPGRGAPPPLRKRASSSAIAVPRAATPPPLHPRGSDRPAAPAPAQVAAPPPLPRGGERAARARRSEPPPLHSAPPPPLQPPAGFAVLPPLGMMLGTDSSELTFFVRLDPARADVFDEEAELLVQLSEPDGHPVVLFTLIGGRGAVTRVGLDGLAADTRALLDRLERVFRATVALFADNELRATRAILAPREANARAILERLSRPRRASALPAQHAIDRALREPPPLPDDSLPFGPPRPQPATTASVLAAVRRIEQWIAPEKIEQALTGYSVPKHVIDASCRRVLRAAIGFGISLPPRLVDMAVEQKLADSRGQLVREQLEAFRQRIERQQNDLSPTDAVRNWERLFAQADQLDVEVPRELRDWVQRSAAQSGAPPPDLPLSSAELRRDLGDPGRRMEAIRELCRRGHASAIPPIVDVLEELSAEEVPAAVVALLGFGERAADGLMFALAAPSQHVRHACALGLGQLKLARSLPILIRQIETESTPSWSEMARALGDFGKAALGPVAEALKASDRRERLMLGLAHLANHGCVAEVKSLESDPDSALAMAARQALVRRARMEAEDDAVRTQQPLRDNSPEVRFSQAFFAEVARMAS